MRLLALLKTGKAKLPCYHFWNSNYQIWPLNFWFEVTSSWIALAWNWEVHFCCSYPILRKSFFTTNVSLKHKCDNPVWGLDNYTNTLPPAGSLFLSSIEKSVSNPGVVCLMAAPAWSYGAASAARWPGVCTGPSSSFPPSSALRPDRRRSSSTPLLLLLPFQRPPDLIRF